MPFRKIEKSSSSILSGTIGVSALTADLSVQSGARLLKVREHAAASLRRRELGERRAHREQQLLHLVGGRGLEDTLDHVVAVLIFHDSGKSFRVLE